MMGRLLASLARDLRVQYRAHYVLTAVAALAVWIAALRYAPEASGYVMAPAFIFLNTFLLAFSLGLRQAVCEREAGILAALDISPLRPHEFLVARAGSLTLIAAAQNLALALAGGKPVASFPALLLGVSIESVILSLTAFLVMAYTRPGNVIVARLLASALLLGPPLAPFLGLVPGGWLGLHPLQGPLLLLQGAFFRLPLATFALAVGSGLAWCAVLLLCCRAAAARLRRE